MANGFKRLMAGNKQQGGSVLGVNLTPQGAGWCVLEAGPALGRSAVVAGSFRSPLDGFEALCRQSPPPALSCQICLSHEFYSLLLVDAPNVPDAELREAVKWRVKDLIAQPIEKMVLDVFRLPADAYRGRMNMVYVALMEKVLVAELVAACEQQHLRLRSIGIAELALAAVTRRLSGVNDLGLALLYLSGQQGSINLIENGYLYLTRTLELSALGGGYAGVAEVHSDPADNLALDVQRSLDYYESQLGKSGVARLYVMTESQEQQQWCAGLSQRLPIRAQTLALGDLLANTETLDSQQQGVLVPAVGAVLAGVSADA